MPETSSNTDHLSFSQRYGYTSIPEPLLPEELTSELRNELDAAIKKAIDDAAVCFRQGDTCYKTQKVANWHEALRRYSVRKFGLKYEQFNLWEFIEYTCLPVIAHGLFHQVLEIIEDLLDLVGNQQPSFVEEITDVFHRHQAPYIVKKRENNKWWIVQTGTSYEHQEVLNTFASLQDDSLKYVRDHLEKSGHELAKGNYVLSVDECLKALEACARFCSNLPNKTGGDALKECNKIYSIPFPLYKVAESVWIYRNDAPGVGHAMKDGKLLPPDRFEAQMVYVVCCGVISFLINKKNSIDNPTF